MFSHVFQQSILTGEIPKEWSLVVSHVFQQSILTDEIPKNGLLQDLKCQKNFGRL